MSLVCFGLSVDSFLILLVLLGLRLCLIVGSITGLTEASLGDRDC
jgi:hypothetical protein